MNTLINNTKILLIFFITLLLSSLVVNAKASDAEELKKAFEGKTPFYAITVTRTTPTNEHGDYRLLLQHQIYLLFTILENVLGSQDHYFIKQLDSVFKEEIKKYKELESKKIEIYEKIKNPNSEAFQRLNNEIFNDYMNNDLFSSINIDGKKEIFNALKSTVVSGVVGLIKDKKLLSENIFAQKKSFLTKYLEQIQKSFEPRSLENKAFTRVFSKEEQQFIEYWKKNESQYEDLVQKSFSLYKEIITKMENYNYIFSQLQKKLKGEK